MITMQSNRLDGMTTYLTDRVTEYWHNGFYFTSPWWLPKYREGNKLFPEVQLRRMLRDQAKEWQRPFVSIEMGCHRSGVGPTLSNEWIFHVEVSIPRQARCEVIAAPLLVLPKDNTKKKRPTIWEFQIDRVMWESYSQYLCGDWDVRRVFNIPDEVPSLPFRVTPDELVKEATLKWPLNVPPNP